MYWVCGVIVLLYIILFLISGRQKRGKAPPGIQGFFYPMAVLLYKKACQWKLSFVNCKQVQKDLRGLYPGKELGELEEDYYVKKISFFLLICLLGVLLGTVVSSGAKQGGIVVDGKVLRSDYTQQPQEIGVSALLESGEEEQFTISVFPYQLSKEEIQALLEELREELPWRILGQNPSAKEVTEELLLESYFAGYPFEIEWKSSNPEIVSNAGMVGMVDEATEVILTAELFYGEAEWEEQISVIVIPPAISEEERMKLELAEMLETTEMSSRDMKEWLLPAEYQGSKLVWKEMIQDNGPALWLASIAIAVVVFLMSDKDLHDEWNERREEMKRAYPDIVQKLVLYLGAGMTVRAAFQRIALEYEAESRKGKRRKNPQHCTIYEEIQYMCRELQAGISEGTAYEHFGKRTGVQEYLRLSTLLAQNLKKGNSTLLQRLKVEAEKASTERLQSSRRLGEEASTKLLLPMVMLLMVVMLMVIIPTFSSMGM